MNVTEKSAPVTNAPVGLFATLKREHLDDNSCVYNVEVIDRYVDLGRELQECRLTFNCHDERRARLLLACIGEATHAYVIDATI